MYVPFYPTIAIGSSVVFVGALTVNTRNSSDTNSALYSRPLAALPSPGLAATVGGDWVAVPNAPRLDEDAMPKDRMALLVNPSDDSMLFVAGNAGALTWRVDWVSGTWTETSGRDTADGSEPHSDCRNYYWEATTGSLILLSDGGAFLRTKPAVAGGVWRSLNHNTGAMELISAHLDPKTGAWVGGAQDNTVMLTGPNPSSSSEAVGYIFGDGTVTAVDASVSGSSRFYGCTQFLGNFDDDDAGPRQRRSRGHRSWKRSGALTARDDDHVGFGYAVVEGGKIEVVGIPVLDWFDIDQFPFFDHPFALNTAQPTGGGMPVVLWARAGRGMPSGFYSVDTTSANFSGVRPHFELSTEGDVYSFVAGGVTAGAADPSVLVGLNNTHLFHRSSASKGILTSHQLPVEFARPVEFGFWDHENYILGPVSHGRTVSLAVSSDDAALVAVSGWTTIRDNEGAEGVWLSADAGASFLDVTGDLQSATGVCNGRIACGKWRPSALLLLPLTKGHALLAGTVSGVFAAVVPTGAVAVKWSRLGACTELPLALVAGLSHEPLTDTVVAATMGRGVFTLPQASRAIATALGV